MKTKLWLLISLMILVVCGLACSNMGGSNGGSTASATVAKNCDTVLAEIGSNKICMSDFQARLEKIPPFYRKRVATKQGKLEYLNRMVEDELFYLEAINRGFDKDPEVVDQLDQIRKSILSGKIKKDMMEEQVEVTDDQVKKYYDEHQDEFMSPETVSVRHILFRVKHKATDEETAAKEKAANDVLAKIKSGSLSFKDAAKKYSEDKVSAKKGGDLAPVKKGIKSAEFEKVAFAMATANETSAVFKDRRGYNIVQFVKKTEPDLKDYAKVEARIKRKMQQDARKDKMDGFSESLRKNHPVVIKEELLIDEEVGETAAPGMPGQGLPLIGKKPAPPKGK
jgi:peptidyl-prolyl cis-trans isomerase C